MGNQPTNQPTVAWISDFAKEDFANPIESPRMRNSSGHIREKSAQTSQLYAEFFFLHLIELEMFVAAVKKW